MNKPNESLLKLATLIDLKEFKKKHSFFVGIDSDGTIFNSMKLKHESFYLKPLIKIFNLEKLSAEVKEIWYHINIFSSNRGINRFKALVKTFEYLSKFDGVRIPDLNGLKKWIKISSELSDESLSEFINFRNLVDKNADEEKVLTWSREINNSIKMSKIDIAPFEGAKKALRYLYSHADIIVISNTPLASLNRDWEKSGLKKYISLIGGQETGTKFQMLNIATRNKYEKKNIMVIGDSLSDYRSAKLNNSYFFPIIPGSEAKSWEQFLNKGLNLFFNGNFKKNYEKKLIERFKSQFEISPTWS